jgi:predicted ATPase
VTVPFVRSIRLSGLLSFPPEMEAFDLRPLNVLIGPNGSGKSNLIEAFGLIRALPTDFAAAIREGGGIAEWLWKGRTPQSPAEMVVDLGPNTPIGSSLRHQLEFAGESGRFKILDEQIFKAISEGESSANEPIFAIHLFALSNGDPVFFNEDGAKLFVSTSRDDSQAILAQRRDPDILPTITWLGNAYSDIQIFREWSFGRYTPLRQPQPADLPDDILLPDSRNLALLLNQIEHHGSGRFNELLKRFFPRFERMSTRVSGGTLQFFLHETDFPTPIPATRLSDGTLRFIALLAILLAPDPPPLVCIEEPELGLHPDVMELLAELFVEASQRMQLIVTTHSDALVSALTDQPDAIVACERIGAGTVLRRLDPERLKHWLDEYRLGDLWRIGELGANP